jgi:long-chain acyl-CoA synthetase
MHALGVNVVQGYGSSDFGFATIHNFDNIKWETCGPPVPGAHVRVMEEGELLVRKDVKWLYGYYKDTKTFNQSISDGWFYSGDFGHVDDDGHVIVMDRMKDLRKLKGGQRFSPQYTEIRLRFSPFIKNALIIGEEESEYVSALINIDIENVGRWAEARRIVYTTFTDLSQNTQIINLICNEIKKVNRSLPDHAKVKKFVNLHKELDPDEAELTRTRKIRRTFLEERYGNIISALYSQATELEDEVPITYRDGRQGMTKGHVKVNLIE